LDVLIGSFAINQIPPETEEYQHYLHLLLGPDIPLAEKIQQEEENSIFTQSYFRKTTMEIILRYIQEHHDNWENFKYHIYKQKGSFLNIVNQEVSYGWYFYQMNEYWHYAIETLFWSMLYLMDSVGKEYNNLPVNILIVTLAEHFFNEFTDETETEPDQRFSIEEAGEFINSKDEKDLIEKIKTDISRREPLKAAAKGLMLLFVVWHRNKDEIKGMDQFVQKYGISRPGDVLEGLKWIEKNKQGDTLAFIQQIIQRYLINRHLHVAFSKMGAGTKNTLKFNIEHNIISHLETIEPTFTTPRIYSLYQIMADLGLIDKEGKITEAGGKVLNES